MLIIGILKACEDGTRLLIEIKDLRWSPKNKIPRNNYGVTFRGDIGVKIQRSLQFNRELQLIQDDLNLVITWEISRDLEAYNSKSKCQSSKFRGWRFLSNRLKFRRSCNPWISLCSNVIFLIFRLYSDLLIWCGNIRMKFFVLFRCNNYVVTFVCDIGVKIQRSLQFNQELQLLQDDINLVITWEISRDLETYNSERKCGDNRVNLEDDNIKVSLGNLAIHEFIEDLSSNSRLVNTYLDRKWRFKYICELGNCGQRLCVTFPISLWIFLFCPHYYNTTTSVG